MIWSDIERASRNELRRLQEKRLIEVVERVYNLVPFYRKKMDEKGIKPSDIRYLEDISLLPFTYKDDLRDNYPFGLFAVPLKDIVEIHASSGTTGKPVVAGYTRADIELWSEVMARVYSCAGVNRNDIIQNAYGYGLFTGGLGFHYGALKIGATVVPASSGNTRRQLMLMEDFGATVLCCTPSYSLYIREVADEEGVDFKKMKLRVGLFGAEPWSENMRKEIEEKLNIKAIDIYGLTEIIGPGVSCECIEAQKGLHINEDAFYPEIIDPETGEVLPEAAEGELVFTTLTKEGIPLIRYRTRDISSLNYDPCICGRTNARMSRIKGRSDDMLIIRGVNLFPSQIESIILKIKGVEPHYQLVLERKEGIDTLEIQVEVSEGLFKEAQQHLLGTEDRRLLEDFHKILEIKNRIKKEIKDYIGVTVDVKLLPPKSIQRSEGKAKRVIDKRPK